MGDRSGYVVAQRARRSRLAELDRAQCLDLLRGSVIGRVVFTDSALPAAQPVAYLLDGEEVVFRTGEGTKLAAATCSAVIAFEVDEVDLGIRTGWSVLGIGRAYEVTDLRRWADLATRMPEPRAPDATAHTIAVPMSRLAGRRTDPAS
ncbi:pyridoxamine 5'-phosphate oxidase family protein [Pseudonocardia sp. T1-2H]|uniref:pyridoxamine 5'-phosphate oxidase family protein n=1 Tax=Pseudonocardia sp. T1-2H TaxID=3128899 RepID=UPI003101941C